MDVKYFLIVAVKYRKKYFQELQNTGQLDSEKFPPPPSDAASLLPSLRVGYSKGSGALLETLLTMAESQSEQ